MVNKREIEQTFFNVADSLQGKMDPIRNIDFTLSFFFMKYLVDNEDSERFSNDGQLVIRSEKTHNQLLFDQLHQSCFHHEVVEEFEYFLKNLQCNCGFEISVLFEKLELSNRVKFTNDKVYRESLSNIIEIFSDLDLSIQCTEDRTLIVDIFQTMYEEFYTFYDKKSVHLVTPSQLSHLLIQLVEPRENSRVYDSCAGIGSTLMTALSYERNLRIYGNEVDGRLWALGSMNFILHDLDPSAFSCGDMFSNLTDDVMTYDYVVGHISFSLPNWDRNLDRYDENISRRFPWGIPQSSKGDWGFISYQLTSLGCKGKMAVVVQQGCLFRGGKEAKIRENILKDNLLDSVIALPSAISIGTKTPYIVLVFSTNRQFQDVVFIDGSNEACQMERRKAELSENTISKIRNTVSQRASAANFSKVVSFEEIARNNFDLTIASYVEVEEEKEIIDLVALGKEIALYEEELTQVQKNIKECLAELMKYHA